MLDYLASLFGAAQFVPHAVCLLWRPDLLIMHGASDLLISAAYLTIPVIILKAVDRRPDLLHPKVARLFAAFITACALSHLAALLTLWVPAYGLQGVIKLATALVSIYTAVQLARLLPEFLTMPSRAQLARTKTELESEHERAIAAQEARERLDEFAHIASHDLRAPMRGIANQARFLAEDHGDALAPDAQKRLTRMQELCGQLDRLISALLQYSRLGRSDTRHVISTKTIVSDVRSSLEEVLQEEAAEITVETPLPDVWADPSDFTSVVQNLVVNGLTYNDAATKSVAIGYVDRVSVGRRVIRNAFYVRDNGIGIDPDMHEDIFKMFKRLNRPEAYGDGTGAGLAFVRKVIEANGGTITLVSAPGQGSTFYFTFPQRGEAGAAGRTLQAAVA